MSNTCSNSIHLGIHVSRIQRASLEFGLEKVYVITNGMYLNLPTSFVTGEKSGEMLTMVRLDEDAPADSE